MRAVDSSHDLRDNRLYRAPGAHHVTDENSDAWNIMLRKEQHHLLRMTCRCEKRFDTLAALEDAQAKQGGQLAMMCIPCLQLREREVDILY